MFYLYHHHDLQRLAELLAVLLARRDRRHALEPDTVIVPNHGVGRWLQMELAGSEGVAANLEMPLLARFIWRLIPQVLGPDQDSSDFEQARLRWHIYSVLPAVAERSPAVAHYLAAEAGAVQRLQLACRLADVFDEYLIYRPGLLRDWEAGRVGDAGPESWQAEVWRALIERLGANHRANLLQRFVEAVGDESAADSARLPDAVYCFGLGQLPPEYVKFLYALARRTDVHFLLPNPCEAYWGDIRQGRARIEAPPADAPAAEELAVEAGHPLLASLGRGTRDLLRVLYSDELSAIHEPELGEALAYEPPGGDALLGRVQADIIAMEARREGRGMADGDASVQVHACHGPLREVQVLQDQLLDLMSRDPDLSPRDIVVMAPDMNRCAPAIQSVFGAAEGARYLPFSLSDRSRGTSHPIVQSFRQLLDLPLSRWTASEIFALAAVPAIGRRFGLDEASLDRVRDWAQAAGVRWGLDAGTRERFGAGTLHQNTWRFGLDRLILGTAQSDEESLTDGVAPWADLEGGSTAAVGSLWQLVERLQAWEETFRQPATARSWLDRLNAMVDDLFVPDAGEHQEGRALEEVREAIAVLGDAAECLEDEPLPWEAVREILAAELAMPASRQPFLSGGITFCGLVPLRAVPFKVVCLLGMDDGAFPRQERNRGFNILRAHPRLGDHSARDDDRLLFLQALTAARDVFYISYTGQDVGSGETLPPSPVVGEWLDFLHLHHFAGQDRNAFEKRLITRQPMHPFSRRYFDAEPDHPRLFTFAAEWQPSSRAAHGERHAPPGFVDGSRPAAPEGLDVIDVAELRRFFDHPARYLLDNRLQIRFETLEQEVEDRELLELAGLNAYRVRAALLRSAQRQGLETVDTRPDALWRARGELPPPPLDAQPFAAQAEQVNALLPVWRSWTQDGEEAGWLDVDFTLDGHRLVGRLNGVWPDGPRLLRPGGLRMQYRLRGWIDYLAYRAAGHEGQLRLAGTDGRKGAVECFAEIGVEDARSHLAVLLGLYGEGQCAPLLFLPDLAEAYLRPVIEKKKSPEEALRSVNSRLTNTFQPARETQDPYFARLLTAPPLGEAPGDTRFCELAEAICEPVVEGLRAL